MYIINNNTLFLEDIEDNKTKVVELEKEFFINENSLKIVNESCKYYGSSYNGRLNGTKNIIGINYKAPIILEESSEIIFFPTNSPRLFNCNWLSLKNIKNYEKYGNNTKIYFKNDKETILNISYKSFDNQILRSARLQMVFKNRKINLNS